jgi:hypothetical protein
MVGQYLNSPIGPQEVVLNSSNTGEIYLHLIVTLSPSNPTLKTVTRADAYYLLCRGNVSLSATSAFHSVAKGSQEDSLCTSKWRKFIAAL